MLQKSKKSPKDINNREQNSKKLSRNLNNTRKILRSKLPVWEDIILNQKTVIMQIPRKMNHSVNRFSRSIKNTDKYLNQQLKISRTWEIKKLRPEESKKEQIYWLPNNINRELKSSNKTLKKLKKKPKISTNNNDFEKKNIYLKLSLNST